MSLCCLGIFCRISMATVGYRSGGLHDFDKLNEVIMDDENGMLGKFNDVNDV
jgi:hypothetical protein